MDELANQGMGDQLIRDLAEVLPAERTKRWRCPKKLKQRAISYAEKCRENGEPIEDIAGRLGLVGATLARWLRRYRGENSAGFRSVSIVPADSAAIPKSSAHLTLVTPRGYRVEGLDLASAAHLLRSLG